nr:MAG: DNA polymerase type B, organellar and viral [Bacteriophage sp.]
MRTRNYKYYVCDFETTVYKGQQYTEVWAAAVVELNTEDVVILHSIQDFLGYVFSLNVNIVGYFHNLKFDGNFIVDWLLRNGYNWNRVAEGKMKTNEFKCAISDRGAWYTITIKKGQTVIEFRDSLKLLPFSVKRIGKSFKTKHKKLDMEYEGFRYAGCEITDKEKEYIANDVLVVKEALEIMFERGHQKLTIGSCCLEEFKSTYDKTDFKNFFPNLTEIEIDPDLYGESNADAYIRHSYRGGYCYLVKGKENKIYSNGWTADINSSYPSNMSSESGNYYPVGKPMFWKGDIPKEADNKYYFVRIRCRFNIKEGMLPTVQIKGTLLYNGTDYLTTSDYYDYQSGTYKRYYMKQGVKYDSYVTMTMTCVDYELFLKHYNPIDLEVLDGCYFMKAIGLFDEYMYKYKEIKENSVDAERELAKLYLNNLYGKFSANDSSSYKVPYINSKNVLGFEIVEEHEKKPGFIAVGSAITSYARRFVINAAQANFHGVDKDGFIYCDTDSIHCSGKPEDVKGIRIHPTSFCAWKLESYWDKAVFVRQKTYMEHVTHVDGKEVEPFYNIRCAGMSEDAKQEFLEKYDITDFKEGLKLNEGLKPVRMPGGIVLEKKGYHMTKKQIRKFKED